jgi:hypothetical protein
VPGGRAVPDRREIRPRPYAAREIKSTNLSAVFSVKRLCLRAPPANWSSPLYPGFHPSYRTEEVSQLSGIISRIIALLTDICQTIFHFATISDFLGTHEDELAN